MRPKMQHHISNSNSSSMAHALAVGEDSSEESHDEVATANNSLGASLDDSNTSAFIGDNSSDAQFPDNYGQTSAKRPKI